MRYLISGDSALLNLLKNCKDKAKCEINFSVLLSKGKIQQSKGYLFDRLDSFLSVLADYKSGVNEYILTLPMGVNNHNFPYLKIFLDSFADIYDYCDKIYFKTDRNLVDMLIENGKKPILSKEEVKNHLNLAQVFWNAKSKGIEKSRK